MKKQHKFTDAQFEAPSNETCTHPHAGGRLTDYLADPLNCSAAKEVEDHLLECLYCREFFIAISSIRSEARMLRNMNGGSDASPSTNAKVARLSDFKKEWP